MAWRLPGICPDAAFYIGLANALEHGTYLESSGQIRFNIYPIILSSLHQLGLPWETAGVTWGVLIASCTALPLFGWIRRAFSRPVAIAACTLYAIHSGLIRWSVEIIRDPTFWFLLTMSLYLLWRAVTELRWSWYLAAGAAIALACLTRFEGLVLYVPLLGWSWQRGINDHASRRRLIAAGLVCASVYPLSFLFVNTTWHHGQATELVRTKPVELAQNWAQESIAGQRPAEKQSSPWLLPPLPLGKMIATFATGMLRGFTPLYFLAVLGGIAGSWRDVLRRDWPLAGAAALILAAIWVHLYWSHEAGPRYFFPIVIITSPLAGSWLLRFSALVAKLASKRFSLRTALAARAVPLSIMLVVNVCVAWGGDFQNRVAAIELGRWVQAHYGVAAKLLGPDGITQVIAHYAQCQRESFPETALPSEVSIQIQRLRPNIALLSVELPEPARNARALEGCFAAQGFEAVDPADLPGSCKRFRVLTRREGAHVTAIEGRQRSLEAGPDKLAGKTSTGDGHARDVLPDRRPVPVTL